MLTARRGAGYGGVQKRLPVFRQRGLDREFLLREGVRERQLPRVEGDDAVAGQFCTWSEGARAAVLRVAQYRVAAPGRLHAKLMHSAGERREFHERAVG